MHFLYQLVFKGRDAKRTEISILFGNVRSPNWFWVVPLLPEQGDDFFYLFGIETIYGLSVYPLGHVSFLGVDVTVRQHVEVWIEQVPVQSVKHKRTVLVRHLTQHCQNYFSVLHCAYLRVPSIE